MPKILFICIFIGLMVFCGCAKETGQNNKIANINGHPSWVEDFINAKKIAPIENPPASISQCNYNNNTVYYQPAPCCDMFSTLYDWNKNKICSPSGGTTGQGDGKCQDFSSDKNSCSIIWQDTREPLVNNKNINQ